MGILIDTDKTDQVYRCNYIKKPIIYINLACLPLSLGLLIFGIIRMLYLKKCKTFLTKLILIIFFSEVVQCISKILQILKYAFADERNDKSLKSLDLARGVICQIQIVLAISSDFCSLLSTLILSLRCYDLIKNKKKFFDSQKNEIIAIILDISISIIISIVLIFIDRKISEDNVSYRYDKRDRCTYWCWLEHITSLVCYCLYFILLIINIVYAFKTYCFLNKGYNELLKEVIISDQIFKSESHSSNLLNQNSDNINISSDEKRKIKSLNIIKMKSLIYPLVTIIYWIFAAIYRIFDDAYMMQFDFGDDPEILGFKEQDFFNNHKAFQITVQIFLVIYTFFSAIRGILYGFAFVAFEEKIFFNFFKKVCNCCLKMDDSNIVEEVKRDTGSFKERISRNSYEIDDDDDNYEKKNVIESEMANQDYVSEEG